MRLANGVSSTGLVDGLKIGGREACSALNIAVRDVSPSLMEIVGPSAHLFGRGVGLIKTVLPLGKAEFL